MKTFLNHLLLLAALALPAVLCAQDDDLPALPEERMQEIKAQKTAYLTQQLDLSPEEAQKFWPVYNQYDKEVEAVRKEMREFHRTMKKDTEVTEAEASAAIDKEMAGRQKELDIRKKYAAEFKKTIGAVKTMKLGIKRVRDRMQDRREGGRGPGGRR
jgi:Spy/CpxP family protein refolding chaperone